MSFSVNVMTRGPGDRVAAMLSLFRGVADEILVALDDRAGPEVEAPLAAVADRVIRYPYADPVDRPLAWLHAECRGDWVLTIDDDEVPMQALLDALPALARADDVTHYWLPRRWLFGELDRWLDARPWRPDYQPRLVLNDPRVLSFPTETHVPVKVLGPSRYLDAGFYHLDTLLNSREAREEKARRYERSHPGKRVAGRPLNEAFYVPELVDPPTPEVPPEDLRAHRARCSPAAPERPPRAELRRSRARRSTRTGPGGRRATRRGSRFSRTFRRCAPAEPRRSTCSSRTVSDGVWPWGGATIRLGSRWARRRRGRRRRAHRPLPADLAPGACRSSRSRSSRRPRPGRWTLEVDLVHEHVRWFDRAVRVEVEVLPARRRRRPRPGTLEGLARACSTTLDPEDEPVVVSDAARSSSASSPGRIARLEDAGASRVVVPEELVREGTAGRCSTRSGRRASSGSRCTRRRARSSSRARGRPEAAAMSYAREARPDHRRARLHRLQPRAARSSSRAPRSCSSTR